MKRGIIINIDPNNLNTDSQKIELSSQRIIPDISTPKIVEQEDEDMRTPLQTDRWIYRIVVSALALSLVSSITGAVYLQAKGEEIPDILTALGSGALGGLAGLLAPTPTKE
ncbi:MAG: hypothetical protein AAF378_05195 [Cyanobacteria bacterium P01_A01_bin.84]